MNVKNLSGLDSCEMEEVKKSICPMCGVNYDATLTSDLSNHLECQISTGVYDSSKFGHRVDLVCGNCGSVWSLYTTINSSYRALKKISRISALEKLKTLSVNKIRHLNKNELLCLAADLNGYHFGDEDSCKSLMSLNKDSLISYILKEKEEHKNEKHTRLV